MKVNDISHNSFYAVKNILPLAYNEPYGRFLMLSCQLDNTESDFFKRNFIQTNYHPSGYLDQLREYHKMTTNANASSFGDCVTIILSQLYDNNEVIYINHSSLKPGNDLLNMNILSENNNILKNLVKSNLKIYDLMAKITKEIANTNGFVYEQLGRVAQHTLEILLKISGDAKASTEIVNNAILGNYQPQPIAQEINNFLVRNMEIFFKLKSSV